MLYQPTIPTSYHLYIVHCMLRAFCTHFVAYVPTMLFIAVQFLTWHVLSVALTVSKLIEFGHVLGAGSFSLGNATCSEDMICFLQLKFPPLTSSGAAC